MINVNNLPPPNLIDESTFESILENLKNDFLEREPMYEEALKLESEPIVKILETSAYVILKNIKNINHKALSTMVSYAQKDDLDNIVARNNIARFPDESDEKLRQRYLLSFDALSNAGTLEAYKFHSLDADERVIDASVHSPEPGKVDIYILSNEDNNIASLELLENVNNYIQSDKIRALTDFVEIKTPTPVNYEINVRVNIDNTPLQENIYQQILENLDEFSTKNKNLNKKINMMLIYKAIDIDGVNEVEVLSPSNNLSIAINEFPRCSNINIEVNND